MTKDWEPIFTNWTKPPSDTEESRCENALKMVKHAIKDDVTLSKMNIDLFVQGSYANNTNVKLESDVDITVRNLDYLFCEYPEGKTDKDFNINDSDYSFATFRDNVETALVNYFGRKEIKRGNKAFDIKSNSYRVDADVVACFEHRRYTGTNKNYLSGTEFRPDNGGRVINWPKQHLDNGIQKNKDTSTQFKKAIRILKKLNIEMQESKIEVAKKIPSFLIECLCWNSPNSCYTGREYTNIIRAIVIHLYNETKEYEKVKEWGEINELKYLFRTSQPWTREDVNEWTIKVWNYIGFE